MTNQESDKKRIVVLGGGTGTFTVLSGLKQHDVDLSAVVSIADDGGSTGRLRDEQGVLPPGDIRQCLAALAEGDDTLRNLLDFRFDGGDLDGHNFGNLFLAALQKMFGSAESAVKMACKILRVRGTVIPVSAQASTLYAELTNHEVVEGEHAIDAPAGERSPILRCFLSPRVYANPDAIAAFHEADLIILGPGDLYTSLVPVLLVDGVAEALASTKAKKVYVMNLVAKAGQTEGYTTKRFLDELAPYIDPAELDTVIVNDQKIPPALIDKYTKAGEHAIVDDLDDEGGIEVVRAPVLSEQIARKVKGDRLDRSLIRHDPDKLAKVILGLL